MIQLKVMCEWPNGSVLDKWPGYLLIARILFYHAGYDEWCEYTRIYLHDPDLYESIDGYLSDLYH